MLIVVPSEELISRMRSSYTGPAAVSKYLLPRELQVATVRLHPALLISWGAEASGGLVLAIVLSGNVANTRLLRYIVWILAAILCARMIRAVGIWAVQYFVITSERLIITTGILNRRVIIIPMTELRDVGLERSLSARLLGYGTLVRKAGGRRQVITSYLPYPEQLYLLICAVLFPAGAEKAYPLDEL
jgi:hypothetical protein